MLSGARSNNAESWCSGEFFSRYFLPLGLINLCVEYKGCLEKREFNKGIVCLYNPAEDWGIQILPDGHYSLNIASFVAKSNNCVFKREGVCSLESKGLQPFICRNKLEGYLTWTKREELIHDNKVPFSDKWEEFEYSFGKAFVNLMLEKKVSKEEFINDLLEFPEGFFLDVFF